VLLLLDEHDIGNHLALYIHFIACSVENQVSVVKLGFAEFAPYFQTTGRDLFCRYPPLRISLPHDRRARQMAAKYARRLARSFQQGKLKKLGTSIACFVDSSWETTLGKSEAEKKEMIVAMDSAEFKAILRNKRIILPRGPLFRDQTSIRKHAQTVRAFFRPAAGVEQEVNLALQRARAHADVLVGLYIAGALYSEFLGGQFNFTIDQYSTVMRSVRDLFAGRSVAFMIRSDAELPEGAFAGLKTHTGLHQLPHDLFVMAGCDLLLGPPNSGTSWASFYGQVPSYKILDPCKIPSLDDFVINRG
jgi:hypothetical protein